MMLLVGAVACPMVEAALPTGPGPLPNYDIRTAAQRTLRTPTLSSNAVQSAAVAQLKEELPAVRVSESSILGTPRLVAARRGFLTGPDGSGATISAASLQAVPANDPHRVIKAFLNEHSGLFGLDATALASARVKRDFVTKHNGLHTTVWQQTLDDIPVFEGLLTGHVTRNDELVSLSSQFVPNVAKAADAGTPNRTSLVAQPAVPAAQAVVQAASNAGVALAAKSLTQVEPPQGSEAKQTFRSADLPGAVSVRYVWLPMNPDSMRLCWQIIFGVPQSVEHYLTLVDAATGEVLVRHSLTQHIQDASYNVFTSDSPSPFSPGWPTPNSGQPPLTNRTLVTLSALDTNASPMGWVPDGTAPVTTGNNADAFLWRQLNADATGNYIPDKPRPQADTNRVFDFPMDLNSQQPLDYADASTVQLFYRANWYHDRLYDLGFTEAAGNFQMTNFDRGGFENDPVLCLVQAGADYGIADNSAFYTPPDGMSGECYMFVFTGPMPNRDGSLDQEVVIHELTHGLSSRLVGGGIGISQLQTEGMGEGWSDFYSLCLLSEPTDDVNATYAEGGYVTYMLSGYNFTENYYYGIRRYPYTTDMSKNPLTFKDIDPNQADPHIGISINPLFGGSDPAEVHNQGEVWCMALREVWANLVEKEGWTNGNQLALQLITDGMILAPPNPNFLEARDAILQADELDTGGNNFFEIWKGFAKRGMGYSAQCPSSDTTIGVVESFDTPEPDGILEVKVTPPSWSSFFTGDTVPVYVRVTDVAPVTDATITATISGSSNLVFLNDGISPDTKTNDSTYTATFHAPASAQTVNITLVISAPDKDTSTNYITYYVVAPPPNDNFTNSTKVSVKGGSYLTSNARATLEPFEPVHASINSEGNSLWWDYVPTTDTNVLVDTGGSGFRTVVAVYTNSTLTTLQPVVSAAGTSSHPGAFVNIPGRAGTPYHIAVASFQSGDTGTLRLSIQPLGQPDTNAPVVTVSSPPSGIVVTTNRLYLTGSAVDQDPNPSGIRDITISVSSIPGNGEVQTTVVTPLPSLFGPISTNWSSVVAPLPGLNRIQVVATDFAGNKSVPVTLEATYRVINPPNDFFASAIPLPMTDSGVSSVNTVNATKEVGEPNHDGISGGKSAWWSFYPVADGVLSLNTSNSTFDTVLAVYTGTNVSHLTPVAGNDDAYEGVPGGFSMITQAIKAGTTNYIAVDGYGGASGNAILHYSFTPATVYHLSASALAGGSVQVTSTNDLGGLAEMPGNSGYFASGTRVALEASPAPHYQFDSWSGSVSSPANPLSLLVNSDMDISASFSTQPVSDGFESGNLAQLPWVTSGPAVGNAPWFVQTNVSSLGGFAARSGVITNNQTSSLILTTNFHAGVGTFDYRVSSEENWDWLRFYVNGVLQQQWSGEVAWSSYSFAVPDGTNTLEWTYSKDTLNSSGLDAAFIDNVSLPLGSVVLPPRLSFRREGGMNYVDLSGQVNNTYVFEASGDLKTWQPVSTNTTANGEVHLSVPITSAAQYYRAYAQ